MNKGLKKKIVLARETLLVLGRPALEKAAGGQVSYNPTQCVGYTCPECYMP
jgi:hypothetical protein